MVSYRRAETYPSKFAGERITPRVLVAHTTEGLGFDYLHGLFQGHYARKNADGSETRVGIHWCIYRTGEIIEYCPWMPGEARRSNHAGISSWKGAESLNGWSLGFEIEHVANHPYPEAQIEAICWLVASVREEFPDMELVTHQQIAPLRKSDPTAPWKTDVWPRVSKAWEEAVMPVRHVAFDTVKPELDKLIKAGFITRPEMYDQLSELSEAAGLDWVITMLGRFAEKAGWIPSDPQ